MTEIYISGDVETDGPIPGPHSMLSLGSAAYTANKKLISKFKVNLKPLPGAKGHPDTMEWWKGQPKAWIAATENQIDPQEAMEQYVNWIKSLKGKPVFVGYPATFDFMFVYWYLVKFVGYSPFSFSALDIKSYAMAVMGSDFRATTKKRMPRHWFDPYKHTHDALDDAVEQGALFINILQQNKRNRRNRRNER